MKIEVKDVDKGEMCSFLTDIMDCVELNDVVVEEIVFLKHNFDGEWVVENVKPYYKPLVEPAKEIGRHVFWSSFQIQDMDVEPKQPKNFINSTNQAGAEMLKEWLGIRYEGNIYYGNNHCPAQVLRNCVHPLVGKHVFDCRGAQ